MLGYDGPYRVANRLRNVPELRNVALGGRPLMGTWTPPIMVAGDHGVVAGRTLASGASESYFETLGIPLLRGRNFTRLETERPAPVAVISEATARRFWPGSDAIGRRFTLDMDFSGTLADFEVIGIVKDIRYANLTRIDPTHVYLPLNKQQTNNGILLRAEGDPRRALAAVRAAVESFDGKAAPGLSLVRLEDGPVHLQRVMSTASAVFSSILGGLALLLASVGVYGVMAYVVSRRVKEIGIRMALGASQKAVLRTVVLQGLRPVLIGMAIGSLLAAAISVALHASLALPGSADLFYGVPFYDPATFLGFACVVAAVAALASAVPAHRAIRVDPMVALRHE
jgi:ABC-type antimicrobial peptide transport system permease subunit